MNKGKLFLIPSLLDDDSTQVIPEYVKSLANDVDVYLAENLRTARRYLRKIGCMKEFDDLNMMLLDKKTSDEEINSYITLIEQGKSLGVLSEAGCPCIADPGSVLVKKAHQREIEVKPLVGPSSILMALIASGLNGQRFAFHGYLSVQKERRREEIARLEQESSKRKMTQIFMEVPYRNQPLIEDVLMVCKEDTQFCMAASISSAEEYIATKSIAEWRQGNRKDLHKKPAIFLIDAR